MIINIKYLSTYFIDKEAAIDTQLEILDELKSRFTHQLEQDDAHLLRV